LLRTDLEVCSVVPTGEQRHQSEPGGEAGAEVSWRSVEEWSWREQRTWELKTRLKGKEKRNEEEGEGRHLHYFWSLKLVSLRSILRH